LTPTIWFRLRLPSMRLTPPTYLRSVSSVQGSIQTCGQAHKKGAGTVLIGREGQGNGLSSMTIQAALESSADLSNWLDSSTHGLEISPGDRERMVGSPLRPSSRAPQPSSCFLTVHLSDQHFPSFAQRLKPLCVGCGSCIVRRRRRSRTLQKTSSLAKDLIRKIEALPDYDVGVLSNRSFALWRGI
jgi:hypothetical protein